MRDVKKHNEQQPLDREHHMRRAKHDRRRNDDCFSHSPHHHDHSPLLRGRKFNSEDIQLFILSFLATESSYGYELIKQFSNRTNEAYTPSPGVIYPALTYLEEIEYISSQMDGTRKRYTLTESGLNHLNKHKAIMERLLAKLDHFAERMRSVNEAMEDSDHRQQFLPELAQAIGELRAAIHPRQRLDEEKQKQMITIINETIEKLTQLQS